MPKPSDEDIKLFRDAVKEVKPFKTDKIIFRKKTAKLSPGKIVPPAPQQEFAFSDYIQKEVSSEENLFFHRSGLQPKILRALRQGKISPTALLDLHGTTIEQARSTLSRFLQNCLRTQQRCVQIIHGKGKLKLAAPVLKNHINTWLQQHPAVLAFCSAMPRDGGAGAVYVLLRRNRC